ncbi:peptidoglycan editing factor PgeF [Flocculibacter collagenilyticus]|uniref:peptidoglycan editing factor PgeF n=1 Tax=Flocculibacter collagenilyticus TaxID=2744479 RepID=UPI0018F72E35|nr:peptidoglycan editing factor PgeF [Flocculibacter collagenilyticus]
MRCLIDIIQPNWPAPAQIKAYVTSRAGGLSAPPYQSFNLAQHVGDNTSHVTANRTLLQEQLDLPSKPIWLNQVHGTHVIHISEDYLATFQANARTPEFAPECDGSLTALENVVCTVLTADCLPLLFTNKQGTQVAAVHAGWRGLGAGIIEQTLALFHCEPADILVWLGPAIGATKFEVGQDVYKFFIAKNPQDSKAFNIEGKKWLADIYQLAKLRLNRAGVTDIFGGEECTFTDPRFFSYRRDGVTGRMASLIWIAS